MVNEQEINEAVLRKLGWDKHNQTCEQFTPGASIFTSGDHWFKKGKVCSRGIPPYSTWIAAAWEIVDIFRKDDSHIRILRSPSSNGWICQLNNGIGYVSESADTAPMAICLAFLKLEDK